ncbi:MAG TPA: hypothetical protein VMV69_01320 [Pirellulales bacterium]|nr:hypothetical protein [Pirellulales bacterium]
MTAPAWLVSLVIHALLVIVLGYTIQRQVRGTGAPPGAEFVASLSTDPVDGDYFEDEVMSAVSLSPEAHADESPLETRDLAGGARPIFGDRPPVDTHSALPSSVETAGLGAGDLGQATGAGKFTSGRKGPARLSGGKARTKVYGVEGEGNSFVYVFDHSASMGGGGGSPLASAKRELLASLGELGDAQQFQIIFYNEKPTRMNLGRSYGGLVLADEQTKRLAERFVRGIVADGGTRHEAALEMALKLAPDVIFFLTDADEPQLSPAQLARIQRMNSERSTIHTIEFGVGRGGTRDNFLKEVARQNGGQYVYIDITKRGVRD